MEKLVCKKPNKSVVDFILNNISELNYSAVQKLLRKKDVKINGKRINKDLPVAEGDIVEVYALINKTKEIDIVYSNDNMVIVNKPTDIEVVSQEDTSLEVLLSKQLQKPVYAVHRLDRNTTGLVVFALNINTKKQLEEAFKKHIINKYYLAVVVGVPNKQEDKLVAYHKKDAQNSVGYISDSKQLGYTKIITKYKLLKTNNILSLLEVEIETGKTHQIRAHLSHIGLPVLGDEKYGNKQANKQYKKRKQVLVAYKLQIPDTTTSNTYKTIELPNIKETYINAL